MNSTIPSQIPTLYDTKNWHVSEAGLSGEGIGRSSKSQTTSFSIAGVIESNCCLVGGAWTSIFGAWCGELLTALELHVESHRRLNWRELTKIDKIASWKYERAFLRLLKDVIYFFRFILFQGRAWASMSWFFESALVYNHTSDNIYCYRSRKIGPVCPREM